MGANKVIKRYRKNAENYEAKRADSNKWKEENAGAEKMLPANIKTVLDVPVGTGRFYYIYHRRDIKATGVDSSPAMLKEAAKKGMTDLKEGDIRKLQFGDKLFDAAICVRLFPWFEPDEVKHSLKELSRVADVLVVGIRTKEGEAFCKNGALWNHSYKSFLDWVEYIEYKVEDKYSCGNGGNAIYRLVPCE